MHTPFTEDCKRLSELAQKYSVQLLELRQELEEKVVSEAFSTGGLTIARGFYCPSPIQDIVVGNCNRGKLLRKLTIASKPAYKYGFNSMHELVTVNKLNKTRDEYEIILRDGELELGISFSEGLGIHAITECTYSDEQIISYVYALYNSFENRVEDYRKEEYAYSTNGLAAADVYSFSPAVNILQHTQYRFQHDNAGYLSSYMLTEYSGETAKPSVWDGHVFNVHVKRKV